jgi:hypothetical protein
MWHQERLFLIVSRLQVQNHVVPGLPSDALHQTESSRQCVKLVSERHAFTLQHKLAFANHMHQFDAGKDRARGSTRFETEHRPRNTFDRTAILLDNAVEILLASIQLAEFMK